MTELERLMAVAERMILEQRVDEGMELLNELLFEEPGSAALHNHLGWGYFYFVGNLNRAEKHFETAVRFDTNFAPPYLHLGNLNNRLGRYSVAITWFERGVGRPGSNAFALAEGIALAHEMRGEYRTAIRHYKEALAASAGMDFDSVRASIRRCRSKRWILLLNKAAGDQRGV